MEATRDAFNGGVRREYLRRVGYAQDVYKDEAAKKEFLDAYHAAGARDRRITEVRYGNNGRGRRMGLKGDDLIWYGFCQKIKPTGKTVAFCTRFSNPISARFNGIYFNPKSIGDTKKGKELVEKGWWAPGGETIKGTMAHELGHAIDSSLAVNGIRLREQSEIRKIWSETTKDGVATGLSKYGSTSPAEMIAEAWCEFTCSANPRPLATQIGNLIKSKVERK